MPKLADFDMVCEQDNDKEIRELRKRLKREKATKPEKKKFIILDEVIYYISHPDEDLTVRLYIPTHLRPRVLVQYHDENRHMGADKTYQAIRIKYFWPCLFREVVEYVSKCVTCQTRNLSKIRPRLQEFDIPPFPFAKMALDICGPFSQVSFKGTST